MADLSQRIAELSPEKRALLEKRMAAPRPIAVIGMGCRMPGGADSPESFWRLLAAGVDAVREAPPGRWKAAADPTRWAGLLDGVDLFDPAFFGISPGEARRMDPQQRLLLEVAWEALESAGCTARLAGSPTGVFIGIHSYSIDYLLKQVGGPAGIDTHTVTGSAHSIAANRLSYCLDLRGPSVAIDTACSSSLVAVHLACQSLRAGDCDMALAGGVNLILSGTIGEILMPLQFLAADGRCKVFDARADGFVRGEGCGVVVLKPLDLALAGGDPVVAVIRGSAVNQDGRSNGLTAPSGLAQQAVIRAALAAARVEAASIGYVETHGTGTSLGDPIEVEALVETLGPGRDPRRICRLGSVKTNIGHLEAAAGIAGLIKAILCLRNEAIPPNLHLQKINPHLDLEGRPFAIPTRGEPWPRAAAPRRAGVSSFGFGGTNAHVIVEECPTARAFSSSGGTNAIEGELPSAGGRDAHGEILPLAARSREALAALAGKYIEFLEGSDAPALGDIAYSAAVRRDHPAHRLAVVGRAPGEWIEALRNWNTAARDDSSLSPRPAPDDAERLIEAALHDGAARADALARLAECYRRGATVDWERLYPEGGRCVPLPTYPWRHERYWLPGEAADVAAAVDGLVYELEWRRREALRPVAARLDDEPLEPLAGGLDLGGASVRYEEFGPRLNALAADYARRALGELGWLPGVDAAALAVAPHQRRLLARLLEIVAQGASQSGAAVPGCDCLLRQWPQYGIEIQLLRRCGEHLAAVLRGEASALQVLFPNGSTVELSAFYRRSPLMQPWNRALGAAVARLVGGRKGARILELGAGTGATTEAVLEALRGRVFEYWFTDVSHLFLAEAERCFGGGNMHYRMLDLEADLAAQGIAPGAFDVVLAANVVHATADVRASLRRAAQLLAPGGVLALLEVAAHEPWMDLIFGLTEGWWKFADRDLRAAGPLLAAERWLCLLREEGFAEVARGGGEGQFAQAFLLARKARAPQAAGKWAILPDRHGLAERLAEELDGFLVPPAGSIPPSAAPAGVIDLRGLESSDPINACAGALELARELVGAERKAPLWIVTRGAQAAAEVAVDPVQGALWGLGRVVALERPEIWGGLIDLDPSWTAAAAAARLAAELAASDGEDQVCLRESGRFVARLVRARRLPAEPVRIDPDGAYLVTGGMGGLGFKVARWLAARGARHLVLIGRSGMHADQAGQKIKALEESGARVAVVAADSGDAEAMRALFERFGRDLPALRGVVHAAGVVAFLELEATDRARLADIFRAKVDGTRILDDLTRDLPLDFFVMFSSGAALWGSRGLAAYAAGNEFMNALAHRRRRLGLPALAIDWGWWAGGGTPRQAEAYYDRIGLGALDDGQALGAFGRLLGGGGPQAAVARIDWERFAGVYNAKRRRPLLDELAAPAPDAASGAEPSVSALGPDDAQPSALDRGGIERIVRAQVARVLGCDDPAAIEPGRGFYDMGLDSILSLQLHEGLERAFAVALPSTVAFERPTVAALVEFIAQTIGPGEADDGIVERLAARLERIKP